MTATTLPELLALGAAAAPAIGAPGRAALDFAGLRQQNAALAASLRSAGIGAADRVALVMPNGPAMAALFLGVASAAVAAPLNPAYREAELDFYLTDLGARAVLVPEGAGGPAADVATRLGLRVIEVREQISAPAGTVTLSLDGGGAGPANPDPAATALILHTSGTTSRPKIVPLSQRNLAASAGHIARTLALGPDDCCLNIMPLFHIHGLVAAVTAALGAGGAVMCTPGFNALRFFAWLDEAAPTWFTAVPTMHQAILARSARNTESVERARLRLIRSSSASLPAPVMAELEATFGCPVIESYGMTEACHQMTSSPLPPGARYPGSVGIAAGPEVGIMSADGAVLPAGEEGEVVIRGPNVTAGYERNREANQAAFQSDPAGSAVWFRTGDQGWLDGNHYLRLTGRLKEIINRGGEKIAPREVDDVLMAHDAVAQAVTFALPHPKLGEEVAAAIILHEGATLSQADLRAHAAARLADFKVPRRILFLDEIPKGPTGKLQRIGLAAKLGLTV